MNTLDIVKDLIGFDTTSRDSNLALIDYTQALLEKSGARCRRTYDEGSAKANLFATFGPDGDGGFVLSGHTDVVPVDGQDWSSNPFKPEVRGSKLFGRGACDMKGFVGTALALAPEIGKARLKKPIHFALSYDEEVGCAGVKGLLDDLKAQNLKPALAIIGEPTLMKIVGAHKVVFPEKDEAVRLVRSLVFPDVLDLIRGDAGALDRFLNPMAAQGRSFGVVEGAAIGLADRCAGG